METETVSLHALEDPQSGLLIDLLQLLGREVVVPPRQDRLGGARRTRPRSGRAPSLPISSQNHTLKTCGVILTLVFLYASFHILTKVWSDILNSFGRLSLLVARYSFRAFSETFDTFRPIRLAVLRTPPVDVEAGRPLASHLDTCPRMVSCASRYLKPSKGKAEAVAHAVCSGAQSIRNT